MKRKEFIDSIVKRGYKHRVVDDYVEFTAEDLEIMVLFLDDEEGRLTILSIEPFENEPYPLVTDVTDKLHHLQRVIIQLYKARISTENESTPVNRISLDSLMELGMYRRHNGYNIQFITYNHNAVRGLYIEGHTQDDLNYVFMGSNDNIVGVNVTVEELYSMIRVYHNKKVVTKYLSNDEVFSMGFVYNPDEDNYHKDLTMFSRLIYDNNMIYLENNRDDTKIRLEWVETKKQLNDIIKSSNKLI